MKRLAYILVAVLLIVGLVGIAGCGRGAISPPPTPPAPTPTPDTTEIVLGAPLPDIDGVKILDARLLKARSRIIGEIVNTGDVCIACNIHGTLYALDGRIVDTYWTILDRLEPNQKIPFILVYPEADFLEVGSYEIAISSLRSLSTPLPSINVIKILDAQLSEARSRIVGEIMNTGDVSITCNVHGTLYEAKGRMVDTDWTIIDRLDPDQKVPFTLVYHGVDFSEVASYEIVISSIRVVK